MGQPHRIYLAGPIFSAGEIAWARELCNALREWLEEADVNGQIIWPYELSTNQGEAKKIFQENLRALDSCDLMVAILDGPQVDDGTAWEIGHFFQQRKRVLGIRTDIRNAGEFKSSRINLMIEFSCLSISSSIRELYSELEGLLA